MITLSNSKNSRYQSFLDYIDEEGLRLTTERKQIAQTIFEQEDQFEAEDLLFMLRGEDKNVSRATIYRTLELMVKSGLLLKLDFGDGYSVYQVSDGSSHHAHLYCRHCGKVEEFSDPEIARRQEEICEEKDFYAEEYGQKIFGYCDDCRSVVGVDTADS